MELLEKMLKDKYNEGFEDRAEIDPTIDEYYEQLEEEMENLEQEVEDYYRMTLRQKEIIKKLRTEIRTLKRGK